MAHRTARGVPTAERPPVDISDPALATLAFPALTGLPEDRAAGRACVWDGQPLTIETAIDLGEQTTPAGEHWFPRACRPCLDRETLLAMHSHITGCEKCDSGTHCQTGRRLVRLVEEVRR